MTKASLIIVHGMGEHTEDSFKSEIVDSLNYALSLYDEWKGKDIQKLIDIIPFEYNSIFNIHRKAMADAGKPLSSRLADLQAANLNPVTGEFIKWDAELNSDNFFATHWLDVLFYRFTMLAEPIRIKLGEKIVKAVDQKGGENVHILVHSLGTSVTHDTLASLYTQRPETIHPKNLPANAAKLASVHMVANVSRLLESFIKVGESIVNPCQSGCTNTYYQYRHLVDPFVIPTPFEPVTNGVWIDPFQMTEMQYQRLRPRLVTDLNTHAITHYLRNPECHVPLLKILGFGFWPKQEQINKAFDQHSATALQGKAELLQQRWEGLDLNSHASVTAFIRAGQALRDMLASFGKEFK